MHVSRLQYKALQQQHQYWFIILGYMSENVVVVVLYRCQAQGPSN
jgi:hypothetical protein